jgi:tetratricopeptide (TPR) repeat protein
MSSSPDAHDIRPESIEALRERAFLLHEAGDLDAAERAYQNVLGRTPNDVEVKHGLGALAVQTGRFELAVEHLTAVIRVDETASARDYLGNALSGLSQPVEALACHERAIALAPDFAAAHLNRGQVLRRLGRHTEALASFDRAIEARPGFREALIGRCLALVELQRWEEVLPTVEVAIQTGGGSAEAYTIRGLAQVGLDLPDAAIGSFDLALSLHADYAPALINLGVTLRQLERPQEALRRYETVLAVIPDCFEALANAAAALSDLGRFEEALHHCERATSRWPQRAGEVHLHRAAALAGLERFDEMLRSCTSALTLHPHPQAYVRRGLALQKLGRGLEALADCDRAVALAPDLGEAHVLRGAVLREMRRIDGAIESFARAASLRPDDALTKFALGCLHLLCGNFEPGWRLYDENNWSAKADKAPAVRDYTQPRWHGREDLSGRVLFLYPDQGLGDTLQFARYALLACARGAQVVMAVQDGLPRLLSTLSPGVLVLGERDSPPVFDYHCPLSGLPGAFGTTIQAIPAAIPYLRADPVRASHWRRTLGSDGFKIGVCWQGSALKAGIGRSFPLRELQRIETIPNVRLVSLQKHEGTDQLRALPAGMEVESLGEDFDAGPDSFIDAAAVMDSLDLVITCDTSIAHLAGALGRPAWVALRYVPDWRWMLDRDDSPWYPTLRLFRQSADGDWNSVFEAMYRALHARIG